MSQFTIFTELPQELRDHIWDLAIRDDGPAAHFFTMYDPAVDPHDVVRLEERVHATRGGYSPFCRVGFAAPQRRGTSEPSWVEGNVSTYITDSGLWTACWDSRKRMLWHFRPEANSPPTTPHSSTAPVTMPFRRENGGRQYLTIRPSEDLLCLQFAQGSVIRRESGYHWTYVQDFPWFRGRHWWEPPQRVRHVAVEFDMAWLDGIGGWPFSGLLSADRIAGLAGFWFISYGLERRYRADGDRRGRRNFRTGGGADLVEVRAGDDEWWDRSTDGWWLPSGESAAVRLGGPVRSLALHWAQNLTHLKTRMVLDGYDSDDSDSEPPLPLQYGVLACVKTGSENHLPTKSEWMDASYLSHNVCAGMQSVSIQDDASES